MPQIYFFFNIFITSRISAGYFAKCCRKLISNTYFGNQLKLMVTPSDFTFNNSAEISEWIINIRLWLLMFKMSSILYCYNFLKCYANCVFLQCQLFFLVGTYRDRTFNRVHITTWWEFFVTSKLFNIMTRILDYLCKVGISKFL